jgi:hypothetical protein
MHVKEENEKKYSKKNFALRMWTSRGCESNYKQIQFENNNLKIFIFHISWSIRLSPKWSSWHFPLSHTEHECSNFCNFLDTKVQSYLSFILHFVFYYFATPPYEDLLHSLCIFPIRFVNTLRFFSPPKTALISDKMHFAVLLFRFKSRVESSKFYK